MSCGRCKFNQTVKVQIFAVTGGVITEITADTIAVLEKTCATDSVISRAAPGSGSQAGHVIVVKIMIIELFQRIASYHRKYLSVQDIKDIVPAGEQEL